MDQDLRDSRRNKKRLAIIDRYHDFARSNDLTVEEAYAQFCESFQLPTVRQRRTHAAPRRRRRVTAPRPGRPRRPGLQPRAGQP